MSQSRKKKFSSTSRSPEEVQTEMISLYKCGDNGRSRTISVVWDDGASINSHEEEEEAFKFTRSQSYKLKSRSFQRSRIKGKISEADEDIGSLDVNLNGYSEDTVFNTQLGRRRKSASFSEFSVLDTSSTSTISSDRTSDYPINNRNNKQNKGARSTSEQNAGKRYVQVQAASFDENLTSISYARRFHQYKQQPDYADSVTGSYQSSDENVSDGSNELLFKRGETWRTPFVSHQGMLKLRKQQAEHNTEKLPEIKVSDICTECENLRSEHKYTDDEAERKTKERNLHAGSRLAPDRLEGETEEDAEIRKRAVQSRTRSRGSATVVHIPTASIQMDLHTLYLESITPKTMKKGKTMDESKARRLQRTSHVYSMLDDDNEKKAGRFAQLRQRFKREENSSLDEFQNFMQHLQSNLVEVSDHNLAIYKDSHWSTISRFNENYNGVEEEMIKAAKISEQERDRYEALWELFYAEVCYLVDHLLVLQNVFVKPLEHAKSFGYLQSVDENILFANLECLIEVISQFAEKLLNIFKNCRVSVSKSTETIVAAFKEFDDMLTPQYNEYCLNYQGAKEHLTALKENELFIEFIRLCEQDERCQRRKLEDFLVAPLQHLTKYPLLLKAIRKRTPKDDINNQLLTTTIFDIEQSIKTIEKKISSLVNTKRLQEIMECVHWPVMPDMDQKSIIPESVRAELNNNHCDTTLMNPNRQLIQEGYLTLTDSNKSEFYVFLFDDMLLVTKSGKKMKRRHTGTEEIKIHQDQTLKKKQQSMRELATHNLYTVHRQPIPLDRLKVYDCEDQTTAFKNAFSVVHYNRYHQAVSVYTFQAPTEDEKKIWLRSIKKARDDVITEAYSSSTKDISSDEEYML